MMKYDDIIKQILELTKEQAADVLALLTTMISLELTDVRTFECCPHCDSKSFIKYGFKGGKQRYRCKSCGLTFSATTNSIFAYSKIDLTTWKRFLELMFSGKFYSLDELTVILKLSKRTVFYMRHKICDLMGTCCNVDQLTGVIECDEVYNPVSAKGVIKLGRLGRKRGGKQLQGKRSGKGVSPGLGDDKACILTAIDSNKNLFMKFVKTGKINTDTIIANLEPIIDLSCVYCSDGEVLLCEYVCSVSINHKKHLLIN